MRLFAIMMNFKKTVLTFYFFFYIISIVSGQNLNDTAKGNPIHKTQNLSEIKVIGYGNNRSLSEVPASISVIQKGDLERYSNTSFVPAANSIPGVKMEERSPGSYRLAIRGSALRSPFGVRNVKIYWNEIPFTDPGGNTYLQQIDFTNISKIEVIKGPGGSIYGAGTGGVLLLESSKTFSKQADIQTNFFTGSYGLLGINEIIRFGNEKVNTQLSYSKQQADGYRKQSRMEKDVLNLQMRFLTDEKRSILANVFYSDLYYQTPGGLTKAEFDKNPRQARPVSGTSKSAEQQQASIGVKTFNLGISQQYDFDSHWTNKTSVYGNFTQFQNPAIRNYERKTEQSFGARTNTTYRFAGNEINGKISLGGEVQSGFTADKNYGNRLGIVDTLQTDDEISALQYLVFAQAELDLPHNFFLTVGGSYNHYQIGFTRFYKVNSGLQKRIFDPVLSPRIALLKKIKIAHTIDISAFGSISFGFSPPTVAEVRPSEGTFNSTLNPEKGINYELGFRGSLWDKFRFDVTGYILNLDQTIVSRRTADGAEYFVNTGKTNQKGIETALWYQPITSQTSFISNLKFGVSYTYNDFRFKDYVKNVNNKDNDFSGNWLTGVAPSIAVLMADVVTKIGFYTNITFNYTEKTPLNDANTDFSNSYKLLGGRVGFSHSVLKKMDLNIYTGVDNALNASYSLGNDLNATGGRYYNPAAKINYYGGIRLNIKI